MVYSYIIQVVLRACKQDQDGTDPAVARDHTQEHTLGRPSLDELSARRRDLFLTTHNAHKRQISLPPAGFKPAIPASERPQTHASHRAATGIGSIFHYNPCLTASMRAELSTRANFLSSLGM